ncbi:hypothetical protein SARC_08978 [Sphaeroforma arctica JP610]|uniref:Uncharacterized protein n=1 Tax=Sphaeroforma arctica JP610 TaxID=667725 RepID=A0A0L0FPG7_9EUKA|nr:hypothetical protein SARC_08978 [Sphaeroforma arctica JP610]KNC78599.1 hypothetical protein SARC_08978 [Sphaeroforma arctica JP610]|eukprot:XP_014152501.1 hypothetical protein SARC_08978 [Sphaeroforma arctica JP610]
MVPKPVYSVVIIRAINFEQRRQTISRDRDALIVTLSKVKLKIVPITALKNGIKWSQCSEPSTESCITEYTAADMKMQVFHLTQHMIQA